MTTEHLLKIARERIAQSKRPEGQSDFERAAGRTVRSIRSGFGSVLDVPRIVTDPLFDVVGYGVEQFAPETGREIRSYAQIPTFRDQLEDDFDKITKNRYVPIDENERIADSAAEFLVSAGAGGALARGAKNLPKAMNYILDEGGLTGLAAAAGAGAGQEYARQNDVNPLIGAVLGGTGAGLATGGTKAMLSSKIASDESGALTSPFSNKEKLSKAERTVARLLIDEQGLTPTQAARQVRAAGSGRVPLTLPERVDNQTLIKMQQRLAESPSKAGKVMKDFGVERQKTAIPNAYEDFVRNITDRATASPVAAGAKIKSVSQSVIDGAVNKRKQISKPFYELAEQIAIPDNVFDDLMQDEIISSAYKYVSNDSNYQQALKNHDPKSVKALQLAKFRLDELLEKNTGDNALGKFQKSLVAESKNKLVNALENNVDNFRKGNELFAQNSPRINKLNENIIGVLSKVKDGQPQKALQILTKESPASINYARRIIGTVKPDAWNSIIGAHLREVAEKNNYSPAKILNELSDKTASGNVIRAKRLDSMLDKNQRRAKNLFFEYMNRAQKVKFGSNTAANLQIDDVMEGALGKKADVAQEIIEQGLRGDKLGLAKRVSSGVFDWYDQSIRSGNYEELARIFTGTGSEDFAQKISKINPKDLRGMSEVIGERISEVSKETAKTSRISSVQSSLRSDEKPKNIDLPTSKQQRPSMTTEQLLKIARERIRKEQNSPSREEDYQEIIITPQSNYFEAPAPAPAVDTSYTRANEGARAGVYQDTTGNPTVGIGFNFNSGIAPKVWRSAGLPPQLYNQVKRGEATITPEQQNALYQKSFEIADNDARAYYEDFDNLSDQQKTALRDMSYQMGINNLREFTGLKKALKNQDGNAIVKALIRSKYYKQTPERAIKNARLLLNRGE